MISREIIKNCLYRFCVIYIGSFVVCLRVYAYVPIRVHVITYIILQIIFSGCQFTGVWNKSNRENDGYGHCSV